MSNLSGVPDTSDMAAIRAVIAEGLLGSLAADMTIAIAPQYTILTASYGASILLAKSSAAAAGRKSLTVTNFGPVRAMIGQSSAAAIYEEGIPLEPGQTITFTFSGEDVPLYARSRGYAVRLGVIEK